jgi:peptide-methionine (R)-S-oxide reductase
MATGADMTERPASAAAEATWSLAPAERRAARTEPAFTSPHWNRIDKGLYRCGWCRRPLFDSAAKFDSTTGWPSFTATVQADSVIATPEKNRFFTRTRIRCAGCEAHLGYLFRDGPDPTGLRYCANGSALAFEPEAHGDVSDRAQ